MLKQRYGIFPAVTLFLVLLLSGSLFAQDFSKYHTYDEMTKMLRDMVNSHKEIAQIESAGKTLNGRDIWVVEIAGRSGIPVKDRPGLLIAANFEGNQLIGSELSLYTVDYLLKNYGTNDEVTEKVDNYVFYIIPRVNPDGAEFAFDSVKSGSNTNTKEYDSDNDGRIDEDGPEDLNGDGFITQMRVKDREGPYMIDPSNPKLMKKADPAKGESGGYKVYIEGTDNDGDGFYNEDPAGGVDINRNFQHDYPYYTETAGWHMISENESRGLMDWVLQHKNIAVILTFGESDNLVTPPNAKGELVPGKKIELMNFAAASYAKASKVGMFPKSRPQFGRFMMGGGGQEKPKARRPGGRKPAMTVDKGDIKYYGEISKKYKELTGINNRPSVRNPKGAFFQFGYFQFGVPAFTTPGWGLTKAEAKEDAPKPKGQPGRPAGGKSAGLDADLLNWMEAEDVDGFSDWTMHNHPQLGEVEIGGFRPFESANPPASRIAELGEKHAGFALYLSSLFPKVNITKTEMTDHGGGLFRIKAEVSNTGYLPTSLAHGVVSRSVRPTIVQLDVNPENVISGDPKTSFFNSLNGSGSVKTFEWIIKGRRGETVELKVISQKGGIVSQEISLR